MQQIFTDLQQTPGEEPNFFQQLQLDQLDAFGWAFAW